VLAQNPGSTTVTWPPPVNPTTGITVEVILGALWEGVTWCRGNPYCVGAVVVGTVAVGAYEGYKIHQAKGGKQNIPPSWVTDRPRPGESADDFARRVCTARYGNVAGCGSAPGSEFNKIRKWAQDWIDKHG
jgi:hypothetical protein